jgi:hypothetical protein
VESYIVRVYHRDHQDPTLMKGVVEIVESGEKRAFHASEELWRILAAAGHAPAGGTSKSERPRGGGTRRQAGASLKTTTRRKPT